ncbi:MAG: response regulator transcription factor [Gemmatimonadales bacterium]
MTVPPQVLIVDDDASIRSLYDDILRAEGYAVATAGTGADAMAALARLGGAVNVLVLDIGLPDAEGTNVAKEIEARIGQRPTLYVSGWADEFSDLADAPGRWLVLQKPIPVPTLIAAIDWLSGRRADRPTLP